MTLAAYRSLSAFGYREVLGIRRMEKKQGALVLLGYISIRGGPEAKRRSSWVCIVQL